eukprot:1852954-Pyramimonas_sp.AAC.1
MSFYHWRTRASTQMCTGSARRAGQVGRARELERICVRTLSFWRRSAFGDDTLGRPSCSRTCLRCRAAFSTAGVWNLRRVAQQLDSTERARAAVGH